MAQTYTAGFLDRLLHVPGLDTPAGNGADLTLAQFKNGVARDLESLLNTRCALPLPEQREFPECGNSLLSYGLMDFSHLCLSSSADRDTICAAVQKAIERHEPRLRQVRAALRVVAGSAARIDIVIEAMMQTPAAIEPVQFDAQLDSSTQQYSIRGARAATSTDGAA